MARGRNQAAGGGAAKGRTALSVVIAALVVALAAPPAAAHGALSETYDVSAPVPLRRHSSQGGCIGLGVEDVNKDSHAFKVPRAGVLTAKLFNYIEDWDLGVVDKQSGRILVYAAFNADFPVETVTVALQANQEVDIVACNYSGGPTATASFSFTPSKERLVSVADVTVAEGDAATRTAVFTVGLSKPSDSTVTVNYATADAGATAGTDYQARSGTLSFAPGATSVTVKVPVIGDRADESDEAFSLALSGPSGGTSIGLGSAVGVVVDDDPGTGRRLTVGDAAVVEGHSGSRPAVFTVSLSKASASTVTVSYATADGTATAASDYTAKSGTLSFAPGVTSLTVKVPVIGDGDLEGDEMFALLLSRAAGAEITDSSGLGTVVDDI